MPVTQWIGDRRAERAGRHARRRRGGHPRPGGGGRPGPRGPRPRRPRLHRAAGTPSRTGAGVRLDRLLAEVLGTDLPADGSVDVVSVTGFRRRLPLRRRRHPAARRLRRRACPCPRATEPRCGSSPPAAVASGGSSGYGGSRSSTRPGGCSRRSRCSSGRGVSRGRSSRPPAPGRSWATPAASRPCGRGLKPGRPSRPVAAVEDPHRRRPASLHGELACSPSSGGAWKVTLSRSAPSASSGTAPAAGPGAHDGPPSTVSSTVTQPDARPLRGHGQGELRRSSTSRSACTSTAGGGRSAERPSRCARRR